MLLQDHSQFRSPVAPLRRKLRTIKTAIEFRISRASRKGANKAIAAIAAHARSDHPGVILCEGLWDHPYHWLRLAILRRALAKTAGGLVGLYEDGTDTHILASLRALKPTAEERIPTELKASYLAAARDLLKGAHSARDLLSLTFPGGFPAFYVYDGILKQEYLGTVDCTHPRVSEYVARTLQYLDLYNHVLNRHNIRAVVVSHPSFPRFATLVWQALQRKIPVYMIHQANEHVIARRFLQTSDYVGFLSDRPRHSLLEKLGEVERARLIRLGLDYFTRMRAGKIGQFNIIGIYRHDEASRDQIAQLLGSDVRKPNVVILTSCWSDGPNNSGSSYFTDYQHWLEITLAAISKVPHCNWILRAHPAEFMYGDKMRLASIVKGRLPPNVYLWPTELSGSAVAGIADCIVTPAGTSGIEYTVLGKRVLVSRDTAYTPWEFCSWAHDKADYEAKLSRCWELPEPTQRQQEDALIYVALTFTSAPETRGDYLYEWAAKSWRIWPGLADFIRLQRGSIEREISMMRDWSSSNIDSYNVYKWLHANEW